MDMNKLLATLNGIEQGTIKGTAQKQTGAMKKILESFDAVQSEACGAMPSAMGSMPQREGSPVSMNISLNASGKENVDELMSLLKSAGISPSSTPAMGPSEPPDMGALRAMVMKPESIEEAADEEGIEDLLAAVEEEINGPGEHVDNLQDVMNATFDANNSPEYEKARAVINKYLELVTNTDVDHYHDDDDDRSVPAIGRMTHGNIARHIREYDLTDYLNHAFNMLSKIAVKKEEWNNSPEEEYSDTEYMTKDLSGGINGQKKMYKPAAKGDNPMAVESIKERLWAALKEKKAKPDFLDMDKDGNKKEPMKKAVADKKKGAAPKKGVNPFAKKDDKVKEGWDDMIKAAKDKEKEKGTGKFDSKKTSTGTVYTRKSSTYDDGGTDSDQKKADKKNKK
jgi:hypothetical protein